MKLLPFLEGVRDVASSHTSMGLFSGMTLMSATAVMATGDVMTGAGFATLSICGVLFSLVAEIRRG